MTRAKAIERALRAYDDHGEAEKLADAAYDTALIAGLQRAVKVVQSVDSGYEEEGWLLNEAMDAIRAEIQLRKGAKAK